MAEEEKPWGEKFCQFVESRIRLQLVRDIDMNRGQTTDTHLYPDYYQERCTVAAKMVDTQFKYCILAGKWLTIKK